MRILLFLLLVSVWSGSAEAAPTPFVLTWQDTSTGSAQETEFILQRQQAGGVFSEIARPPANTTTWTETADLQWNTTYCYRIAATNTVSTSAWSGVACGHRTLSQSGPMPPLVLSWQAIPDSPPVVVKINFQPAGVPIPFGYLADTGLVYIASRGHGWSRNITGNGRDRAIHPDQRLDTLLTNSHDYSGIVATWQYDLPNGDYQITLVSGDPGYVQGPQRIAVENTVVVNNVTTPRNTFTTITDLPVQVTDGHLDIQLGPSSGNTILNYVEIRSSS